MSALRVFAAAMVLLAVSDGCGRTAVPAPEVVACTAAMAVFEKQDHLPPQVLSAIGTVESGRLDRRTGIIGPWPWTINVAGKGMAFDTEAEAVAAVQLAQAAGVQSIDVGCMQVNLAFHPHAFASPDEAFDQVANVRYAADLLARLHGQSGSWPMAIAAYHSATPQFGKPYAQTVAAVWRLAPHYGLTALGNGGGLGARRNGQGPLAPEDEVDPGRVLTPEFRTQMVAALVFERQHDPFVAVQHVSGVSAAGRAPLAPSRPRPPAVLLAAEVDPDGMLTPAFRQQMIEAAAFRHRVDASFGAAAGPLPPSR